MAPPQTVFTRSPAKPEASPEAPAPRRRVALFATCLVDVLRPSVGFASARLLEDAGCDVFVPAQTCCGQPAYNSGDRATARRLAVQYLDAFENFDHVVVPSGSCGGMLIKHVPALLRDDPGLSRRAEALASRTHELTSFLTDVLGLKRVEARVAGTATYHDSCSGLRELGVRDQPRRLLASVEGLELVEMADSDVCCGFGGTFSVKYGQVSDAIVSAKAGNVGEAGAGMVLAGDLGCLLNIAGKLSREGSKIEVRHVAEVLAGMTDEPPIGVGKA